MGFGIWDFGFPGRAGAAFLLAVVAAGAWPSSAAGQTEAGEIAGFEGQAGIGRQGAHIAAAAGARIIPGDLLATGEKSRLVVFLRDGSILVLGPHTRMSVDKSMYAAGQRQTLVRLMGGKLRATVAKVFTPGSQFDVVLPTAVAGVRGTGFAVDATDPKLARIVVLSGSVGVHNPSVQAPEVMVPGGLFTEVGEGQPPKPPVSTPPDLLKVLLDDTSSRSLAAATVKTVPGAVKRFTAPLPVAGSPQPDQSQQVEGAPPEPAPAGLDAIDLQSGFTTPPFGPGTVPGREPFNDFGQAKKTQEVPVDVRVNTTMY